MEKKLPLLISAAMLLCSAYAINAIAQDNGPGDFPFLPPAPFSVELPPSSISVVPQSPPPQIHTGVIRPDPVGPETPAPFTGTAVTGNVNSTVTGTDMLIIPTWGTTATDGILYPVAGSGAGFEKTTYIGYSYDGTNYTIYVSVTDSSFKPAQTTYYAFTIGNLNLSQDDVPVVQAYFTGGYAGPSVLGTMFSPSSEDGVTNTVKYGSSVSVMSTLYGSSTSGGDTYQNGLTFEIKSLTSNQAIFMDLSHQITPTNQWIIETIAGNSSID
jgi:hypothetical protein